MTTLRRTFALALLVLALPDGLLAQLQPKWTVQALNPPEGRVEIDLNTGLATGTGGVLVKFGSAVLTADTVTVNQETGETQAEGQVRIQMEDQVWVGENVRYNFKTRQMETSHFRTGRAPVFAEGQGLTADTTGGVYTARSAYVTTDDFSEPFQRVRASKLTIVPGQYFEAWNAVAYLGRVPVFYFPYYRHRLDSNVGRFTFRPGYQSKFGAFVLGNYTWMINEHIAGVLHTDYRAERGFGVGPDVNLHLGRWGETTLKYYYLRDQDPGEGNADQPLPADRQRFYLGYSAMPVTNLSVKAMVRYMSDERVLPDFFESEHRENPQPNTYFNLHRAWSNFSLDAYAQPRINDYFETVERLPEVRLTGFRQQVGASPVYYESESSVGWYRRLAAETNGPQPFADYDAFRADTYHQFTLPQTYFGWLNFTPRVGGRYTGYTDDRGAGGTNGAANRGVFNTGAEVSLKASRLWSDATNRWLDVNGLRHILQPSINYVYVPEPGDRPSELPQFDYVLPSFRLLPIEYPDFNAIDAVDSQNVIRYGLRNTLQTKRHGLVENLLTWDLYADWRLDPEPEQSTFSDVYSDLSFRPRSWLTIHSLVRYDFDQDELRMALSGLTIEPGNRWSWSVGYFYLRDDYSSDPTALGPGNSLIRSTLFYRLNENWGVRATQHYEANEGRMEEQIYSIYRDLRSWTAALSTRIRQPLNDDTDVTVAFSVSLKAAPKYGLGQDAVRPETLLGR